MWLNEEVTEAVDHLLLVTAAATGNLRSLRQFVARGINLNASDQDLRTALHLAAAAGHLEAVRYLVACGSEVNLLDCWGRTPLDEARRESYPAVAAWLLRYGARPGDELLVAAC